MDFLHLGGYAINPDRITMLDLRKPGIVTIHLGSDTLTFQGGDDKKLRELYPVPDAVPVAGAITGTEAAASLEHAKSLWDAPPSFAPATSTAIPTHPVPPPVRSL